jgi:hypothetical protein
MSMTNPGMAPGRADLSLRLAGALKNTAKKERFDEYYTQTIPDFQYQGWSGTDFAKLL